MSIGTDTWGAIYAGMTEARASMRFGRTSVPRVVCSGIGTERNPTELGGGVSYDVTARYLQSDDPAKGSSLGDVCELMAYGEKTYSKYRIMGRSVSSGVVRLQLEDVNGQ